MNTNQMQVIVIVLLIIIIGLTTYILKGMDEESEAVSENVESVLDETSTNPPLQEVPSFTTPSQDEPLAPTPLSPSTPPSQPVNPPQVINPVTPPITLDLVDINWAWLRTVNSTEATLSTPKATGGTPSFILKFTADQKFSSSTDCNYHSGNYSLNGDRLSFSDIIATRMACPDSMEQTYIQQLSSTGRAAVEGGLLQLYLSSGDIMIFRPVSI